MDSGSMLSQNIKEMGLEHLPKLQDLVIKVFGLLQTLLVQETTDKLANLVSMGIQNTTKH